MNFSKEQLDYIKNLAKPLIDDGENVEYTRGICELIADLDPKADISHEDRSDEVKNEILLNEERIYTPSTAGELIKYLQQNYNPETKLTASFWGEDDIRCMNKDDNYNNELDEDFTGMPLTDEQVTKVLKSLHHNHDAEIGINWDKIEAELEWIKENS